MFKRLAVIGAMVMLMGAAAIPAHAQRVSIGVGVPIGRVPVAVAPSPYPGYVWQPAHYVRTPYGPQLVRGAWVPAPYVAPAPYAYPRAYVAPRIGFGFSFFGGHGWRR